MVVNKFVIMRNGSAFIGAVFKFFENIIMKKIADAPLMINYSDIGFHDSSSILEMMPLNGDTNSVHKR